MKTVEILYPSLLGLYGDIMNMKYLGQCSDKIKFVQSKYDEEPYFVNNKVDMIYIGPMSEKNIELMINKLMPYRERIKELIEKNVIFLCTGNALELFGKSINDGDRFIKCLDIFNYSSKRFADVKNEYLIGDYNGYKMLVYKNYLSFTEYENSDNMFIKLADEKFEGYKYKNFYGTYSLGPVLITNPYFSEEILKKLSLKDKIAYKDDVINAYNDTLKRFNI